MALTVHSGPPFSFGFFVLPLALVHFFFPLYLKGHIDWKISEKKIRTKPCIGLLYKTDKVGVLGEGRSGPRKGFLWLSPPLHLCVSKFRNSLAIFCHWALKTQRKKGSYLASHGATGQTTPNPECLLLGNVCSLQAVDDISCPCLMPRISGLHQSSALVVLTSTLQSGPTCSENVLVVCEVSQPPLAGKHLDSSLTLTVLIPTSIQCAQALQLLDPVPWTWLVIRIAWTHIKNIDSWTQH